ncbi:protein DpdE [Tolumonas osonensis]|uniref:ATP-dependent helicase HepA n=1 Tax=Tolumonas osonensis TaxID=675874 RepID=A0A841GJJ2_9GAMM|nr:protein DpdE [Tolumonas osonensis]MBB6055495.1 ATP-dependent helicase HepA [Tolumonas osonensis]
MDEYTPLEAGDLVYTPYGIGRLIRIKNNDALIQYFDSPVHYEGIEQTVEIKYLKKANLYTESLVYCYDYDLAHWQIARVIGAVPGSVRLHFPNNQQKDVSLRDIFVRWDRPISDAAALLAERITYTPFWQDARLAYQHQMLKQRKACAGITSALSSSIELEPYQLAVARRVLSDPIQRYLLADEVGLGKTIEAGLIVRQHVTENQFTHCVVIVAPKALHRQWQHELSTRFHLEELLNKSIHIIDMADLRADNPLPFRPDMMVIDEAHQIGAWAWDAEHGQQYARVNHLAQQSEKLLLLSATPVTGNEKNFLAMLHLLDTQNYPLTDTGLQKFQLRIQQREEIGSLFYAFNCDNDNMTLEENLEALTSMFPEDEILKGMAVQLLPHLDIMQSLRTETRDLLINKIRHYIGNRYRLHHRLLRNRRSNPGISILIPGLSGLSLKKYAVKNSSNDMMIAWRESAVLMHPQDPMLAAIYELLFEAAIATPELLAELATCRLQQPLSAENDLLYSESQLALLQHPLFDGEKDILLELIERCKMERDSKRQRLTEVLETLLDSNAREIPYIVVFCDQPWIADQVFTDLMMPFIGKIQRHNPDKEVRFSLETNCQILVCDRRAEEGVNLHGGRKIALHYDLLLSPNRIEQRLGRLNRYCANENATSILSMALVSETDDLQNQWLTILNEVFNVFEESIASLQYLVDEELKWLNDHLYSLGEESMMQLRERLDGEGGRLAVEKQRIEMQEVLLQIDGDIIEAREYADALAEIDEHEAEFHYCARNLMSKVLRFDFILDKELPPAFRYRFNPGDWVTGTLVSPQRLQKHCRLGFDLNKPGGSSPMTWPLSYNRADTTHGKIRPARLGEPFHDAILRLLDFEERGIASAVLRITPRMGDEQKIFFRYDFLIEANVKTPAQQRLADHLMPPETITLWLNLAAEQITNVDVLKILDEPYSPKKNGGHHLNLNEERWAQIAHCISAKEWRIWCDDNYNIAQRLVTEQFATQQALSLTRLEHYLSSAALYHADQQDTGQTLRLGITQPKITCLATRALIIASENILLRDLSNE